MMVLERTEGDPNLVAERLEALEGVGDIGANQLTAKEWYSYYEQFLKLNHDRKARAMVLAKAGECWDQMGLADVRKAKELLDEAESLSEGDPRNLAVIERERGDLSGNAGDYDEALAHYSKAKGHFEEAGDSIGALKCEMGDIEFLLHAYRLREAKALAEELLSLAKQTEDPELVVQIEISNASADVMVGETELAKMHASEAIRQSDKLEMRWTWRNALGYRSFASDFEGDFESARIDMLKALDSYRMYESASLPITICEIYLGLYELETGHNVSAEGHYEEGVRIMAAYNSQTWLAVWAKIRLSILGADLLAARGGVHQSDDVYNETMRKCEAECWWIELVDCRSRYGMSLAGRGMQDEGRTQFYEAMKIARRIGCEKRVHLMAKQVGIVLDS